MSLKITCNCAVAMFALGTVVVATVAKPAEASFSNDLVSIKDADDTNCPATAGCIYMPVLTGTCYSEFVDFSNPPQHYALLSHVYYFTHNELGQQIGIAFATLRNVATGQVLDGGYLDRSQYPLYYDRTVTACSILPL